MIKFAKQWLRTYIGSRSWGLVVFRFLRFRNVDFLASKDTDIVIEGYPRCANTFAVVGFRELQASSKFKIAHHVHVPAQVLFAVRNKIPAIVLIRSPVDAVASLMIREPSLSASSCLNDFISFYKTLLPFRNSFVKATIERVTNDLPGVIDDVNLMFGTEFVSGVQNQKLVNDIYQGIEKIRVGSGRSLTQVSYPTEEKNLKKDEFHAKILSDVSPDLICYAEQIYNEFCSEV